MQAQRSAQMNMVALAHRVQPLESELAAAKGHRATVRNRLEKTVKLHSVVNIGSHARGTAIRRFSDMDLLVVFRKEEVLRGGALLSSDTVIRWVLDELRGRFVASDIRKDGLAACIGFGSTKQSLDVVPAVFARFDKNGMRPVFLIPDGSGSWIETSPQVHDRYFAAAQHASGNKLRKVSQLIKWWKHGRATSLPIRSFYADMVLSAYGICSGPKTYGQCLLEFFQVLEKTRCAALADPCGISGRIGASNTETQRQQLVTSVGFARMHAEAALIAQAKKAAQEANRQWNLVFNGNF
jgi:predicted nucleotidyltransferase